jgi:serine/threonine protein kinase
MREGRLEFTFHQCLGKGGFGEVYLATVKRPGGLTQKAAVKVLKEGLRKENEAVQRLQDEGRMLATLNHPCILRVHELIRVAGRIALITEYVRGIDLARCAKKDRLLPPRVVIMALGEVAGALDCAWNTTSPETGNPLKLIHRDIKPENIRVSIHGQVKLLDFGIARTTEMHRHAHTQAGDLPFTPGYAAPEAFTRGFQGPASDIYALGVTMFRLITGERLYEGMELGSQVSTAAMPERYAPFLVDRMTLVNQGAQVSELISSMLAYESEERPGASEVRESCDLIADNLKGPTLSRWARAVQFPPPRNVKGTSLAGKTLTEDPTTQNDDETCIHPEFEALQDEPALVPPPQPKPKPMPTPRVSELTPGPSGSVGRDSSTGNLRFESASVALRPRIPTPRPGSAPPPVPASLGGSVRPETISSVHRNSNPGFSSMPAPLNPGLSSAKTVVKQDGEPPPLPEALSNLPSLPEGLRTVAPTRPPMSQRNPLHAVINSGHDDDTRADTLSRHFTEETPRRSFFSATTALILILLGVVIVLSVAVVAMGLLVMFT